MTVEQAKAALQEALSTFKDEMDRDTNRGEGSGRQDEARMRRQQTMSDKIAQCERDLEEAKCRSAGK